MADVNISVGADTSQFSTGMASIRNEVGRVSTSVSSSLTSLVNPATLVTAALTSGVFAVINYADKIYDTAQRFKVGTTELQQFGQAAEKNGSSLDSVAKAFNKLDVALSQARAGNKEMQRSLENLNIKDWADRSQSLSDNMLKVGTSSMEASDMVKVLGKSGTELRETLAQLASGQEKLAAAMDPKTVEALSKMSDSFKEAKNQLIVLGGSGVGWLAELDKWLLKARDSAIELRNSMFGVGSGGLSGALPTFTGTAAGAGGLASPIPRNPAPPPGTPSADDLARTEQFFDLQELIEQTLEKEQQVWNATHTTLEKLKELQNERAKLQTLLSEAITEEGEGTERVWELDGQIADITLKIVPLEAQIAKDKQKQADESERQAELDAEGLARADASIRQSQEKLRLQELIAGGHEDEARLLEIEIDFNNRIRDAIETANRARQDGLELTAEENELLAQQLTTERERALTIERQNQELKRQEEQQRRNAAIANQIRDAAAALLFYNLRIGETNQLPSTFHDPATGFTGTLSGEALRLFNMIRDLTGSLALPNVGPGQQQSIINQINALLPMFQEQIKLLESINKNLTPTPGGI